MSYLGFLTSRYMQIAARSSGHRVLSISSKTLNISMHILANIANKLGFNSQIIQKLAIKMRVNLKRMDDGGIKLIL